MRVKLTIFSNIFKQFLKNAIPVFAQVRSLETDNEDDRGQARFQWQFETKSLFFSLWYFCGPVNTILNWQSRLAWYELDEHLFLNLALSQQKFSKINTSAVYGCMFVGPFVQTLERMDGFL